MTTPKEPLSILSTWAAAPTDKSAAQAMIAAVKADVFSAPALIGALTSTAWDETPHASQWTRLFLDALVCAGFHKSDGWWLEQLAKLPASNDMRALPALVARYAVRYVESTWDSGWPTTRSIQETLQRRSAEGFTQCMDLLSNYQPGHPIMHGVLTWVSTFPAWQPPQEPRGMMEWAKRIWPSHRAQAEAAVALCETEEDRVRQFVVTAAKPVSTVTPTAELAPA